MYIGDIHDKYVFLTFIPPLFLLFMRQNNAMKEGSETRKKVRPAWLDTILILAIRCGMNTALNFLYGVGIAS